MIIDTHAHFGIRKNQMIEKTQLYRDKKVCMFLEDLAAFRARVGERGPVQAGSVFLEDYLQQMERYGITAAWVHQLSFEDILGYQVLSNREIANAVQRCPGKLFGFASVDPRQGRAAVLELKEAIKGLGLHGFKLNPNDYGGFRLNQKELLYPLYEACCELKIPISLHTGITPSRISRMKWNHPLDVDDVAVDFPELTIIVEHMGYPWNNECYYMVGRHKNMYLTVTAVANLLVREAPEVLMMEFMKMKMQVGMEKILWGSDWTAAPNIGETLGFIQNLQKTKSGITPVDVEHILGGNAQKILPVEES